MQSNATLDRQRQPSRGSRFENNKNEEITVAPLSATEEKPRGGNGDFPLDHILPVFNLNKKESSFIPTLKIRQKDGGKQDVSQGEALNGKSHQILNK